MQTKKCERKDESVDCQKEVNYSETAFTQSAVVLNEQEYFFITDFCLKMMLCCHLLAESKNCTKYVVPQNRFYTF